MNLEAGRSRKIGCQNAWVPFGARSRREDMGQNLTASFHSLYQEKLQRASKGRSRFEF
jgi:hypothetical protein